MLQNRTDEELHIAGVLNYKYGGRQEFLHSNKLSRESQKAKITSYSYLQNIRPFSKTFILVLRMRMFTVRAPHSTVPWATTP